MSVRTNAVFRDVRSREVVETLLDLHFQETISDPIGGRYKIADLTWGKGAFWGDNAPAILGLDIAPRMGCQIQADACHVPLKAGAVDVVVFDPPHMFSRGQSLSRQAIHDDYSELKDYPALIALYVGAAIEIRRVARRGAIIKFTDMIKFGRLHPSHLILGAKLYPALGWPTDIAILDSGVVRPNPSQIHKQKHLRNAHSYFFLYSWTDA